MLLVNISVAIVGYETDAVAPATQRLRRGTVMNQFVYHCTRFFAEFYGQASNANIQGVVAGGTFQPFPFGIIQKTKVVVGGVGKNWMQ